MVAPVKVFFEPLINFFKNLFDTVWTNIQTTWNNIVAIFTWAWNNIVAIFTPVVNWFKDTFDSAWSKIKETWDAVSSYFSGIWTNIENTFSSVGTWFNDKFSDAWTNIKNVFSPVGTFFAGIWDTIESKFTDIGQKVGDTIGGVFKTAINGVLSAAETVLNAPINAINSLIDNINDIPGLNLSELATFNLPRLARGGVLKKGEIGLLEGNGAEAVVPLENNKRWISAVAREMSNQTNGVATIGGGLVNNSHVNNFTQVINAPKMPSRLELYRQTKNLLEYKGGMV